MSVKGRLKNISRKAETFFRRPYWYGSDGLTQTCYGLNFKQGRAGKSKIVQTVKELMEGEIHSGFVHSARCRQRSPSDRKAV